MNIYKINFGCNHSRIFMVLHLMPNLLPIVELS